MQREKTYVKIVRKMGVGGVVNGVATQHAVC